MRRIIPVCAASLLAVIMVGACEKNSNAPTLKLVGNIESQADHELGRRDYLFRCYFCHGDSDDAHTLAANFLNPLPRNFTAGPAEELPRERMIVAITDGRAGTAMKGLAGTLTTAEISAAAYFITTEFLHSKSANTSYHTEANGWHDHEQFTIAFPFANGEITPDAPPFDKLTAVQREGRQLFMTTCISCHDGAKANSKGPAWAVPPVTYPPDYYLLAESGRAAEHSGFDPHHAHEKPPTFSHLTRVEKRGEHSYQKNCAFRQAADGIGRNWIGSFLEPNAADLTSVQFDAKDNIKPAAIIHEGIDETSVPA